MAGGARAVHGWYKGGTKAIQGRVVQGWYHAAVHPLVLLRGIAQEPDTDDLQVGILWVRHQLVDTAIVPRRGALGKARLIDVALRMLRGQGAAVAARERGGAMDGGGHGGG